MSILMRPLRFLREFWAFLRVRKKYWLFPVIVVLLVVGGVVVLAQGSAVAPMVYTFW